MATTIARSSITDDDVTGTVGTVWDAASLGTIVYDKVDGLLSTNIVFGGTVDSQSSAEDSVHTDGGVQERGRSVAMGVWTAITYAATNLGTSSSGSTWASSAADQRQYSYMLIGKTLFLDFDFQETSVGESPNTLRLDLPAGNTVARSVVATCWVKAGGTSTEGAAVYTATSGTDYIDIYQPSKAAFAATTDNTAVYGMAVVPVA